MKTQPIVSILAGILTGLFLLSSCSMEKYCPKPSITLPKTVYKGDTQLDSLATADMEWWEMYTDSTLQKLIRKTLANNRNMQVAISRIRELRYTSRSTLAENFPSLRATAYANNEIENYYKVGHDPDVEIGLKGIVSWEYNLFGAQAWSTQKVRNQYLASIEGQRALQMSLISQVAKSYFELISLDQQLDIVKRTIETRRESMEKAELRFKGGLTSETTFRQTIVEYASAATLVPDLEKQIGLKENELALLAGEFPSVIERSSLQMDGNPLPVIRTGLPSELLLRRPDIRKARAELDASMAEAGFYFASRFPSIKLSLDIGLENNEWKNLFVSPYYYPLAAFLSPLFSFGKNQAKYKASLERYLQVKASYENQVLKAFKEVNDAMITYQKYSEASSLNRNLQIAASKYVELAELQYLNGVISYMDVLDAQRTYFSAQLALIRNHCAELLALIDLYKALGGGWNEEFPENALTDAQKRKQEKAVRKGIADSVVTRPGLTVEETIKTNYREFLGVQATESTEKLILKDLDPEPGKMPATSPQKRSSRKKETN